ncbi:MAG: tetratricopeptide repeat protein [Deltaproteobacteria bacterium]|nr:tetratricopeptide repeat protein [Deltaproteobacteria bacterium]
MTEVSYETKRLSCADVAPLLEQTLIGESIPSSEQETLDRHLHQCDACADFFELIQGLSEFAPEESSESVERTLHLVTSEFFDARSSRRRWMFVGLAAAAAVVAAVLVAVFSRNAVTPKTAPAVAECVSTSPTEVVPGVWLSYCENHRPLTKIDSNNNLLVTIEKGAAGISADPNRPDKGKISIGTAHGEVQVLGTVFTVHKEEEDSRVEVFRGKVAVHPNSDAQGIFSVNEGHGAWFFTPQRFVLSGSKKKNVLKEKLLAVVYAQPETKIPVAASVQETAASDEDEQKSSLPVAKDKGTPRRGGTPVDTLDALLSAARNCLISKQWECAAEKYRAILKHYPKRWEASSAYISLAKIELRHLGKPVQAKKNFSAYRKRYPSGPLISDAFFGVAECERQLGNADNELKTLRSFVQQHPDSPLAIKANKRIEELRN